MARTRIKFCGMKSAQDAAAAVALGVDAIGMIFHTSARRFVGLEMARQIVSQLPSFVTPVGVFVNRSAGEIREATGPLGITHIQLHGEEGTDVVKELADRVVVKVIKFNKATIERELTPWKVAYLAGSIPNLRGIMLESDTATGGSGIENDWDGIAAFQQAGGFDSLPPIIVAGGLTPENVGEVVRKLHPYAVDLSSGIEAEVGKKSPAKMEKFVAEVEAASRK